MYVFIVLRHERREVVYFNVTEDMLSILKLNVGLRKARSIIRKAY